MTRTALIVLAHPDDRSFNAQLKNVATEVLSASGYCVEVSDLNHNNFDPVEAPRHFRLRQDSAQFRPQSEQRYAFDNDAVSVDVAQEIAKLSRADLVVFQYPMWWHGMPAILKGWIDRVFTYGGVYTSGERYDRGRFKGKRALISVTAGAPEATFLPDGRNADIDLLLWPSCFTLYYVGFSVMAPFASFGVEGGLQYSEESEMLRRLEGHKENLRRRLLGLDAEEPLRFNSWADWDTNGRLKPGAPSYSSFVRHT